MNYGVLFDRIEDHNFAPGYYYAHIPSLGLTTHGFGIEGANQAARDLLEQWISEKRAQEEPVPEPGEFFYSTLELSEDAIQST